MEFAGQYSRDVGTVAISGCYTGFTLLEPAGHRQLRQGGQSGAECMSIKTKHERDTEADGAAVGDGVVPAVPAARGDKPRGSRKPPEDFMTTSGAVMQEIYTPADLEKR